MGERDRVRYVSYYTNMYHVTSHTVVTLSLSTATRVCQQIPGSIRAMFSNKPGELLVQTAIEEKAIMIVTGSRGLGKMRRTILGSVSDYVLHNAQCPVFICRKGTL